MSRARGLKDETDPLVRPSLRQRMATRGSRPVTVGYNETKGSDEAQMSARSGNPGLTMRPAPIGGQRPRAARTHPIADAAWAALKESR